MKKHLMLMVAALLAAISLASGQDNATPPPAPAASAQSADALPELQFFPSQPIVIKGVLRGEGENFTRPLMIGSGRSLQLNVELGPLTDTTQNTFLLSEFLEVSPARLSIEAGKKAELFITIQDAEGVEPGHYTGELELTEENSGRRWALPVEASLRRRAEASIYSEDDSPAINIADASLLNFLLPRSIRQEGLNIRIDNKSEGHLSVSNISFALKGRNTNVPITQNDFNTDTVAALLQQQMEPKTLEMLSLPFDKRVLKRLPPDTYEGEFRIYFVGAVEPLSTKVTVNKRMGAFGAVVLLILGIVVGRWIKGLDKARNQMELMERFVPLRVKVDNLTEKLSQKHLWDELAQLEAKIDKVQSDEARAEVEALFPPLEKKVIQIRELEALYERFREQSEEEGMSEEAGSQASQQLRAARDAILDGNQEEAQAALGKLNELIEAMDKEKSKGIFEDVALPAAQAVKRQMDKLFQAVREGEAEREGGEQPGSLERFFFRAMQLISGVKISARFRYGFIRPLVTLATFIVLLLLGFNEIYINDGGATFGADGITDYLKLFLWGVVSDVFSRSLTSDELVGGFMSKS